MSLQRELARLDSLAEKHGVRFLNAQTRILLYLADNPDTTLKTIAKDLKLHPYRLRDQLDLLCEESLRKRGNLGLFRHGNEVPYRFSLTPKGRRVVRNLRNSDP